MAPPRTYRCEAITLGYTTLGEADLLVTIYTKEQGKIRAVAKGARRSTSKLVGHLEPLTLAKMSMAQLLLRLTHHVAVHSSISSKTLAPIPKAVRTRELCWAVFAVLAVLPVPLAKVRRIS